MHDKPQRIQLSRRKGFSLQAHSLAVNGLPAVKVDRTTPWGNPFIVGRDGDQAYCVKLFSILMSGTVCLSCNATFDEQEKSNRYIGNNIQRLRGKNLACWCPLDKPCHADTLLEIANR